MIKHNKHLSYEVHNYTDESIWWCRIFSNKSNNEIMQTDGYESKLKAIEAAKKWCDNFFSKS